MAERNCALQITQSWRFQVLLKSGEDVPESLTDAGASADCRWSCGMIAVRAESGAASARGGFERLVRIGEGGQGAFEDAVDVRDGDAVVGERDALFAAVQDA